MSDLRECPLCASKDLTLQLWDKGQPWGWEVMCEDCCCTYSGGEDKEATVMTWNTRPSEEKLERYEWALKQMAIQKPSASICRLIAKEALKDE